MFDLDKWQEIIAVMRANKLRTLLSALGVAWGIFMLVVLLAATEGMENGVSRSMRGFATNAVYVWGRRTTLPYAGMQPGRWVRFDNRDVAAVTREIAGVEHLAPRNQLGGFRGSNTVSRGDKTAAFSVMGDYPQFQLIQPMALTAGRFVNDIDIADRRKVAVIGREVAEVLFKPGEDPVGDAIQINGVYFLVVGTFRSRQKGGDAERTEQTIYVPFTTFQQAFNYGDRVGWLALTARPDVDVVKVEDQIRALLSRRHDVSPADRQAIGSFNAKEEFDKVRGLFGGMRVFIWFVGIMTLLAGVIGLSNIMLISVKERTKEIGVRKALGATPYSVVSTIIQESIVLTSMAGYVGVIVSVFFVDLVAFALDAVGFESEAFAEPSVDLTTALIATVVLIVSGAVAGFIPAYQAARVDPVEALRAE